MERLLTSFSALVFVLYIADQKRKLTWNENPLIDIRLFQLKDFNIDLLAVLFHFSLHTGYLLLSAVYLQNGLGISALECGLYFILPGVLFVVSSVVASRMIVCFGKNVLLVGVAIPLAAFSLQMQLLHRGSPTLFW